MVFAIVVWGDGEKAREPSARWVLSICLETLLRIIAVIILLIKGLRLAGRDVRYYSWHFIRPTFFIIQSKA